MNQPEMPRGISDEEVYPGLMKNILKAIETVFAPKGAAVVESNRMAFLAGREFAEKS